MNLNTKIQFAGWLKQRHPAVYRRALGITSGSSLGEITTAQMIAEQDAFAETSTAGNQSLLEKGLDYFLNTVTQLTPVYIGASQAKQCVEINVKRAKAGLSPIDCAGAGITPTVGFDLSPQVRNILWGGLALGAVFLFMRKRRG